MITTYIIALRLEFDNETKRDNVYTKLKTALAAAKVTDAWTVSRLDKTEALSPVSLAETV